VTDEDLDRLIEAWADRHAPAVIERAQADALAAAARRLQGRFEEALLRAAARTERPRPAPESAGEPLIWVYGIAAADADAPQPQGVDGHAVAVHRRGGLVALISHVPARDFDEAALGRRLEDLEDVAALARAHDGVLEAAAAQGAVVPFRLCTIYASADRLDAMLADETAPLSATLRRLAGSQEWGVKAYSAAPITAVDADSSPASGTAYLTLKRERREAAEEERQAAEEAVASLHARLAERAADATVSAPHDRRLSGHDAEMLLNAAYLVPTDGANGFRALVEHLRREHAPRGLEIELTGPWPPYHFVDPPSDERPPG
jgi:hypothetical protein